MRLLSRARERSTHSPLVAAHRAIETGGGGVVAHVQKGLDRFGRSTVVGGSAGMRCLDMSPVKQGRPPEIYLSDRPANSQGQVIR